MQHKTERNDRQQHMEPYLEPARPLAAILCKHSAATSLNHRLRHMQKRTAGDGADQIGSIRPIWRCGSSPNHFSLGTGTVECTSPIDGKPCQRTQRQRALSMTNRRLMLIGSGRCCTRQLEHCQGEQRMFRRLPLHAAGEPPGHCSPQSRSSPGTPSTPAGCTSQESRPQTPGITT